MVALTVAAVSPTPSGRALHLPHIALSDPRTASLSHLIQAQGVQRNRGAGLRLATQQLAADRAAALIAPPPPAARDWRAAEVEMQINANANIVTSSARRWRDVLLRSFARRWQLERGESSYDFVARLKLALEHSPALRAWLKETGQDLQISDIGTVRYVDLISKAQTQPERSAFELLFLIHRALLRDNAVGLGPALSVCRKLPLAPHFNEALAAVASDWRRAASRPFDLAALDILLDGVGWSLLDEQSQDTRDLIAPDRIAWVSHSIGTDRVDGDADSGFWVTVGNVPSAWLGRLKVRDLTVTTMGPSPFTQMDNAQRDRLRHQGTTLRCEQGRNVLLPPYSVDEDHLSVRTARVSRLLMEAVADIAGPDLTQDWFPMLDLVVDDLLFATTREFWSVLHHLRQSSAASKGVFCASGDMGAAYAAALGVLGSAGPTHVVQPADSAESGVAIRDRLHDILETDWQTDAGVGLRQAINKVTTEAQVAAGPRDAAMLVGRRFDRNYLTDLKALGQAMQAEARSVIYMPTAVGGLKGRISTIFDPDNADWYGHSFHQPATTLSVPKPIAWTFRRSGILQTLLDNLRQHDRLDPLDLALIIVARSRLEAFYNDRFLRYIEVGTLVSSYVAETKPAYLVLLPGRDFIARVAAVSARAEGIPSYDVQTVFVGARSRYKPTVADVQLTIETESRHLFQSYFKLAPSQTILAGCAKVGSVRKSAEALDRDSVRALVVPDGRFHLIFAGSPFLDADRPIIDTLVAGLNVWPDTCLGIRLHPTAHAEFADYCAALCVNHPGVAVLSQLDLPQTLVSADLLVTRFSNVGLEAALLGRDVIACNFTAEPAPIRLDLMGVASAAHDPADLISGVADFRMHGPRWHQLQASRADYCHANPQLFANSAPDYMRRIIEDHAGLFAPITTDSADLG